MIRLFRDASQGPIGWLRLSAGSVFGNLLAAAICAALGFFWFGVAFAAGDLPRSDKSTTPYLFLWATILTVVIFGAVLGSVLKYLPWLAMILTPLFLGVLMALPGDRDGFAIGLQLGSYGSALYLGGALAGKGIRHRMRRTGDGTGDGGDGTS